jgi:diadenosine tetraphosphate (Ap4A) HIT family hydrolase
MAEAVAGCTICRGPEGDPELERVQVWEDRLWRLTTTLEGEVVGFSYLEPKRHVPHITDLSGDEARTLGSVLSRTTSALRNATGAQLVYVYLFGGGIPHLHIHLAPHRSGDALNDSFIRGEQTQTKLPSGATRIVSRDFPPLPACQHERARERIRQELAKSNSKR